MIKNYWVVVATMAVMGLMTSIRVMIGFIYMMEFFPKSRSVAIGTVSGLLGNMLNIFLPIYFWVISKHWLYYCLIGLVMQVFATVSVFFIPESPKWLLAVQDYDYLYAVLARMAQSNGKELTRDAFDEHFRKFQDEDKKKREMARAETEGDEQEETVLSYLR